MQNNFLEDFRLYLCCRIMWDALVVSPKTRRVAAIKLSVIGNPSRGQGKYCAGHYCAKWEQGRFRNRKRP